LLTTNVAGVLNIPTKPISKEIIMAKPAKQKRGRSKAGKSSVAWKVPNHEVSLGHKPSKAFEAALKAVARMGKKDEG
jgi:hypothetical protein